MRLEEVLIAVDLQKGHREGATAWVISVGGRCVGSKYPLYSLWLYSPSRLMKNGH